MFGVRDKMYVFWLTYSQNMNFNLSYNSVLRQVSLNKKCRNNFLHYSDLQNLPMIFKSTANKNKMLIEKDLPG